MSDKGHKKGESISMKDVDISGEDADVSHDSINGVKSPTSQQSPQETHNSEAAEPKQEEEEKEEEVRPTLEKYLQSCQNGDLQAIKDLVETGMVEVNETKKDNVTALHWACINNQYSIVRYLVENGAIVDYEGGDLNATPVQWACRYGLVYIVDYLLSKGASSQKVDAQGFNLLHLAVHSSNIMLVIYILTFTDLYIDETDPHKRTALHWAAYQGDTFSVHTLIAFGADISKVDETHFTPLHWALIRGTKPIIKELIENGSDVFARTKDNKDTFEVAKDMNCSKTLEAVLSECGKNKEGFSVPKKVSEQNAKLATFFLPYFTIPLVMKLLTFHLGYAIPKLFGGLFLILFQFLVLRNLLKIYVKETNPLIKSPYLAGIFSGTAFWVIMVWVFSVFPVTIWKAPITNLMFFLSAACVIGTFVKAMFINPGYVPVPSDNNIIKNHISELITVGKYDANHFCINTFVRKPLRSKYSRSSKRLVARFDHYCPWVYNEIGVRNHKLFVAFIYSLELCIILFIYLSLKYFDKVEDFDKSINDDVKCSILSENLCIGYNYRLFNFNILVWTIFQLVWLTSLCFVQTFQIFKGVTTFELAQHRVKHQHGKNTFSSVPLDMLERDPSSSGLGISASQAATGDIPATSQRTCLSTLSASVGLDQFLLTAVEAAKGNRHPVNNPTDYGFKTNWLDFWFIGEIKPRNLFFLPIEAENNLNGQVVDYYKLYEYPQKYMSPEERV